MFVNRKACISSALPEASEKQPSNQQLNNSKKSDSQSCQKKKVNNQKLAIFTSFVFTMDISFLYDN